MVPTVVSFCAPETTHRIRAWQQKRRRVCSKKLLFLCGAHPLLKLGLKFSGATYASSNKLASCLSSSAQSNFSANYNSMSRSSEDQ